LETPGTPAAIGSGTVPAGLKFSKSKGKEPATVMVSPATTLSCFVSFNDLFYYFQSTDSSKAQVRYLFFDEVPGLDLSSNAYVKAVAYAKAGFDEIQRKRQRSGTGSEYIQVPEGTFLAFPNSSAQLAGKFSIVILAHRLFISLSFAAASSSSSGMAATILDKATGLVSNISSSPKSERGLVKQEADLRSELDVTISRLNYLLQYFDLIQVQHAQVLKELHVVEGATSE
jgi:hypothetical protein